MKMNTRSKMLDQIALLRKSWPKFSDILADLSVWIQPAAFISPDSCAPGTDWAQTRPRYLPANAALLAVSIAREDGNFAIALRPLFR